MHLPAAITIRDTEVTDLPVLFTQQLDPEANRMAAFVRADPHDRAAFDAKWQRILHAPGIVNKTILLGDEIAGHVSCYPQDGKLEVTYWLGRAYWGKGISTQALGMLLREITHRPVFARAAKDNVGSVRVLRKCGFEIVGEDKGFAHGRGEETEEHVFRLDGRTSL